MFEHPPGTKIRYFGDYELLEEIGRGGMGVVYRARQVSLNRTVAVKMMLAGQLASEDDVKRFYTEAEAAANLQHPNIVAIHEIGDYEGQHYFSMDFVEGRSLANLAREYPLSPKKSAECVRSIAEAVHYAHGQGTLHRDLKPTNILIDAADKPHITDFGLAKRLEGDSELTGSGQILGTPSYMPPEQAAGKRGDVGPASDVYALGAILYELLTGRPPFRADTPVDTVVQVLQADPISPRFQNPKVPRDLETICLKCLEKEQGRRYASAQELADELGRFIRGEPIRARPISAAARTWRWSRRNPAVATASMLAVFLFVGALTVTTVAYIRERQWRIRSAMAYFEEEQKYGVWAKAAEQLGEIGPPARDAVPALVRALEHENYYVRVHAAIALWKITRHPKAIPALIELQRFHPEPEAFNPHLAWQVRYDAVRALGEIGPDASAAVPALIQTIAKPQLGRSHIDLQGPAFRALGEIGIDARSTTLLVDALALAERPGAHEWERSRALDLINALLDSVGPPAIEAVPLHVRALRDKNSGGRLWARSFLIRHGSEAEEAAPTLVKALKDDDPDVRSWAASVLIRIGSEAGAAVPPLIETLMSDENVRVRWRAAVALGAIGQKAQEATPLLRAALEDEQVRDAAAWALRAIQRDGARQDRSRP